MATRTRTGLLLPLLLVAGVVLAISSTGIKDNILGLFGGNDPLTIGMGDSAFQVAADAENQAKSCSAHQVLVEKQCGDLKVVVISAARMPYIARNISLAWSEGHAAVLTKDASARTANYNETCRKGFVKKYDDGSCDEYEFASTRQGGAGARTEEVPSREQACQGGTLSTSYRYQGIKDGDNFLVVISHPDRIADKPYAGQDTAEDTSTCG